MGRVIAVTLLAAFLLFALMLASSPGDAQSEPPASPVRPVETCSTVGARKFNKALKIRRELGGPKPRRFASSPVCIRPDYRRVQAQIKRLRHCQSSNLCIGRTLAAKRGWTGPQWGCLKTLWNRESRWNHRAVNRSSGAGGIPQALPASKMGLGDEFAEWASDPRGQIRWGLGYIAGRYGTPCSALGFHNSHNWY